jgi:acid phosphatase family membrane protein YuiD
MLSIIYTYVGLAWLVAQCLKTFVASIAKRRPVPEMMLKAGGWPSSHSALVSALVTAVGLTEGFSSTIFSVTLVFALIVSYDAWGHHALRRHTITQVLSGIVLGIAIVLLGAVMHKLI